MRPSNVQQEVVKENQTFLDGGYVTKRPSFTHNQVFLGNVPIYVDQDCRDKVIQKGT